MKWIKAVLLLTIAGAVFFVIGCKKTKAPTPASTGSFQLNLKPMYGSAPPVYNADSFNTVTDPLGRCVALASLEFYLSHIYFITDSNVFVKLSDINFFDCSNPSSFGVSGSNLPTGVYKGISFYCGLDFATDAIPINDPQIPPQLAAGSGNHWPMLEYQFDHMEGKWDTACLALMNGAFTYHVGGPNYYRYSLLNAGFSIGGGETTTKTLVFDFEKVFFSNGSNVILDITAPCNGGYTQCTPDTLYELQTATTFANNFSQAFTLQSS